MPPTRDRNRRRRVGLATLLCGLVGCANALRAQQDLPSYGPSPRIPDAETQLLPTLKWSVAEGWAADATPTPAPGLRVRAFARDLSHPRWLLVLPNGDVLVAEAASEPSASWAPRALAQTLIQRRAGSIVESANRITLLRDVDRDGIADERSILIEGLRQPFGMALVGEHLYVANTDSVLRFPFRPGQTRITDPGTKLLDLPVGHHWTRNLLPGPDGSKIFITVGSGSNIAENGIEKEDGRATILELDLTTSRARVFASGLRNANGMAIEPTTGELWTVVNERDEIGDDTPPDYLTSVKEGGFYGWPYSYWGKTVDTRVTPQRPDLVAVSITPDYALGGHSAALGLAHSAGTTLPPPFRDGMFVGLHGSWNRSEYSGYRVVFVPFRDGRPVGQPIDVLTGFLASDGSGTAYGRPVGVAIDRGGALLVADDTGNTLWRVSRD
ncbi:MAG: sorbosone dehydrogenase family protein [Alphaproteobacteria bacterium]|nr:sorbosone dehydrogenase family protein [Alphaproteobacteria bacterium]